MYRILVAAAMVAMLAGCGSSSSTGLKNPNPNAKNFTITIDGASFDPSALATTVGDTVTWMVAQSDTGTHAVHFTDVPSNAPQNDSPAIMAGQKAFVIFLQPGTYSYQDKSIPTSTGSVTVSPLP